MHGRLLGQTKAFLSGMVVAVWNSLGSAYPEIGDGLDRVVKAVLEEEGALHALWTWA